ncbi:hypothetical protein MTR67_017638 [Solanum verrucosum]|uniref:Uncharacterized protein n=1 Tax=Solanum verrucosum TaxID=315347 RepID=A0AAF0QJI0_SOLVR|nr:hypothetical protein MTR67_017638 [Solanum verrucosum]
MTTGHGKARGVDLALWEVLQPHRAVVPLTDRIGAREDPFDMSEATL